MKCCPSYRANCFIKMDRTSWAHSLHMTNAIHVSNTAKDFFATVADPDMHVKKPQIWIRIQPPRRKKSKSDLVKSRMHLLFIVLILDGN